MRSIHARFFLVVPPGGPYECTFPRFSLIGQSLRIATDESGPSILLATHSWVRLGFSNCPPDVSLFRLVGLSVGWGVVVSIPLRTHWGRGRRDQGRTRWTRGAPLCKWTGADRDDSKWMGTRSGHGHHGRWWWLLWTWWGWGWGKEEKTPRDWNRVLQVGIVYQRPVDMNQFVRSWTDLAKHTMVWDPKVYATYRLREAPDIEQKLRDALRSLLLDAKRSFLQSDLELGNEGYAMQALLRRAMEDKCDVAVLLEPTVSLTPRWLNPLVATLASDSVIAAVSPINNQLGFRQYTRRTAARNEPDVPERARDGVQNAPADKLARLSFLLSNNSVISVSEFEGFVTAFPFDMLQREFFIMQEENVLWRAVAEGLQTFLQQLLGVGYQVLLVPKSYVHVENIQPPALQPEVKVVKDMNAGGALTLVRPSGMVRPNYTWHCRPLLMVKRGFTTHLASSLIPDKKFSVLFVLNKMSRKPEFVMRGGWISIVQECLGLALHNVHVRMAIPSWTVTYFEEAFPEAAERNIFLPFEGMSNNKIAVELTHRKEVFDFVVATLFTTVPTVERLHAVYPNSIKSYYVQDIENHFDQALTAMAELAYRRMADGFVFVKTKFLENELRRTYGVKAEVIPPTVDTDRFNPKHRINSPAGTLTVCGMVRTSTPRRNPFGTYQVVARALTKHGPDEMKAIVFGSTLEELKGMLMSHGEDTTLPPGLEFLGNLNRAEVASTLHKCDLFLDFSEWQAFGRSGLECMAAGCIPILPLTGGSSDYAVHGTNAFLVNSSDVEAGVKLIDQVLDNMFNLGRMKEAAAMRATQFSIMRSGKITSDLFGKVLAKKRRANSLTRPTGVIPC